MLIHIIYNTVIGELFGLLSDFIEKDGEEFLIPFINQTPFMATIMFFSALGIIFIVMHCLKHGRPFNDYKIKFNKTLLLFTSYSFILFFIYNIATSIMLIEKI